MPEICPNCGGTIIKKDKYCPVCSALVQTSDKGKKKNPPKRLVRALPYLIDTIIALSVLIFVSLCKIRALNLFEVTSEYGVFSPEAVSAERYLHLLGTLTTVFLVLILIFGTLTLYFLVSKPKGTSKFNGFAMGFTLLFMITVFTASVAYNKHYSERDRIKIIPQSELFFSFPSVYGNEVKISESFRNNLYTYYVSFACAYNDLVKTGDYNSFFGEICKENFPSLDYQLSSLKESYIAGSDDAVKSGVITSSDSRYNQIPGQSLTTASLPSVMEMKTLVKAYSKNNMEYTLADKCITNANLLFDLFYGRELINEKEVRYIPERYIGTFSHSVNKNSIEISSLTLDKNGNGRIKFICSSIQESFDCPITSRKVRFEYKDKNLDTAYGMIHITEDTLTVNIWEKDPSSFMKSDSYNLSQYPTRQKQVN